MSARAEQSKPLPLGDPTPAWDAKQRAYLLELQAEAKAEPTPDAFYCRFLQRELAKVAQRLGLESREEEEAA